MARGAIRGEEISAPPPSSGAMRAGQQRGIGADPTRALKRGSAWSPRVLHVQKVAGIGGSENHLLALLPALVERGVDVHMCAVITARGARFVERLADAGVPVTTIPAGFDVSPRVMATLARLVLRLRPDVIHTHLIHGDVFGQPIARALGVASVSSVHGTPLFYRKALYQGTGRLVARLADWRIAISEHVGRFMLELGLARPERLRVIHYGIDAAPWRAASERRDAERRRLGISLDRVTVGIAARVINGKGHQGLIDAVLRARSSVPSLQLLVAGDGPALAGLRAALARDDGDTVRFFGFVGDVAGFLSACDLSVCPTEPALGEGFGLSALEAMAVGRPVIATRVGSLPEVVVDGESGLVVAPESVDAMCSALVRLARDDALRRRLGEGGFHRAQQHFSLGRMVTATEDLYRLACHA